MSIEDRLRLFMRVCDAVQHAHQKGIIHRDIKPSNVLVAADSGTPKVIDFGVAKALHHKLTERTIFTEQGQLIGTPEYMSPEQAEMTAEDIDTRSDIYSLGVLLYELMTGERPFSSETLRRAGLAEVQRIIREEDPVRPSTRVSSLGNASATHARSRGLDPRSLVRSLRGDLDWIVMKALEKHRARRYGTASSFAADLQRHLDHEPVQAGPPSPTYRIAKFVRRNRGGVAGVAAVLLALLVGLVATRRALTQTQIERDTTRFQLYVANIAAADAAILANDVFVAKRRLAAAPRELRNWEWYFLDRLCDRSLGAVPDAQNQAREIAIAPDGRTIAWASNELVITCRADDLADVDVWGRRGPSDVTFLRGHEDDVTAVAFSPDGLSIAAAARDNTVRLWDSRSGEPTATLRDRGLVAALAFSPDSRLLATAGQFITLWDLAKQEQIAILGEGAAWSHAVAFSSDGELLATSWRDNTVRLWDLASRKLAGTLPGHDAEVTAVAVTLLRKRVVTGASDGTIKVWDIGSRQQVASLRGHDGGINSLAVSPNGRRVASASRDRTIRVWDIASGREQATMRGHDRMVMSVVYSPDGAQLFSASDGGRVRLWDAASRAEVPTIHGYSRSNPVDAVLFSADGTRVVTAAHFTIKVWDTESGEEHRSCRAHDGVITGAALSPDGALLATTSCDGTVKLWNTLTLEPVAVLEGHEGCVRCVAFSPDGLHLASGADDGTIRLWNTASGAQTTMWESLSRTIFSIAFSPDGRTIATGESDGSVALWDAATGTSQATLSGHRYSVRSVAFSPDGESLASGAGDGAVRVWDLETGHEPTVLRGHGGGVWDIAFSPDGSRVASASSDQTIRLWDIGREAEVASLRGHDAVVRCVSFSPDGTTIVSGDLNGRIKLWLSPRVSE